MHDYHAYVRNDVLVTRRLLTFGTDAVGIRDLKVRENVVNVWPLRRWKVEARNLLECYASRLFSAIGVQPLL